MRLFSEETAKVRANSLRKPKFAGTFVLVWDPDIVQYWNKDRKRRGGANYPRALLMRITPRALLVRITPRASANS